MRGRRGAFPSPRPSVAAWAQRSSLRPVGIATALLGLLGNNVLNRRAQVMTEDFKALLLS